MNIINVFIIFVVLIFASLSTANPIGIAVLDSGIDRNVVKYLPICANINFTTDSNGWDKVGHGTNIVGLIENELKTINKQKYCYHILKVFKNSDYSPIDATLAALKYVLDNKDSISFINYSGGGYDASTAESYLVKQLINNGVVFVNAAGNNNKLLDKNSCSFYPACYDPKIIVAGNGISSQKKHSSSNYGPVVDFWEDGIYKCVYVPSEKLIPNTGKSICMTGTSQSTAIVTGKLVRRYLQHTTAEYNRDREYEEAVKTTADYVYNTSGIGDMVNRKVQNYTQQYPKEVQDIFNAASPILRFFTTGFIEIKREF